MARPRVEVVHVGSACRDVVPEDPRGWRLGGGVTYASLTTAQARAADGRDRRGRCHGGHGERARHAARRRGRPVAGAARRGPDLPQPRDAERSGADVGATGVAAAGPGRPRVVARGAGLVAGPGGGGADRRLGRCGAGRCAPRRRVAGLPARAGGGGAGPPPATGASAIMRRADLVGVSHHDVPAETPLSELYGLLHPGADLLVTQGAEGGLLIRLGPRRADRVAPLPADTSTDGETDPTGAGDTFLAAFQASILRPAVVGDGGGRATARPALRGRGRVARRRGAGPRRGAGSRGRARPPGTRADPPGGHPDGGQPGGRGRGALSRGEGVGGRAQATGGGPCRTADLEPAPESIDHRRRGIASRRRRRRAACRPGRASRPQPLGQPRHRPVAHLGRALAERRQRRVHVRGERHVIEPDDADVARDRADHAGGPPAGHRSPSGRCRRGPR